MKRFTILQNHELNKKILLWHFFHYLFRIIMNARMTKNVLFIVEDFYFPQDMRVYNECKTISERSNYKCVVFAPRHKYSKYFEFVDNNIKCYRYPNYRSNSVTGLVLEYLIVFIIYQFIVPVICFKNKINIIHVSNPPDFILLSFFWLKIFGIKFIYDMHDISTETFRAKITNESIISKIIIVILRIFETISIKLSDIIIVTNNSIKEYVGSKIKNKIYEVRNSNKIRYLSINDIPKENNKILDIGYFGLISDDMASGYDNIVLLAENLLRINDNICFHIIGNGGGLNKLKILVESKNIERYFKYYGFLPINDAFNKIINFDFGIVPWPNIPKNNLHTAMKVMDYMCCGVPVCSLNLKEQLISMNGIGIHKESFEEIAENIILVFNDQNRYETLREITLKYFNSSLCWEIQSSKLIAAYKELSI